MIAADREWWNNLSEAVLTCPFSGEADSRFHSSPVQITNQAQRLRRSLLLRFELLNERSKMRWNGSCESVVLVLQALPNC